LDWQVVGEQIGYIAALYNILCTFLTSQNNSYPMREWHVEHMQKTVVKFITGLSDNASSWQKRQHKKYNNLINVRKNIAYDMKHGVTNEEVLSFFKKVRSDPSFSNILENVGSIERLDEVERQLMAKTTGNTLRY
jgi:hypothetical protein